MLFCVEETNEEGSSQEHRLTLRDPPPIWGATVRSSHLVTTELRGFPGSPAAGSVVVAEGGCPRAWYEWEV